MVAALKMRSGSSENTKKDVIRAIADARVKEAETLLLTLQGASDPNMQKEAFVCLELCRRFYLICRSWRKQPENAGYTMEVTGANEAYIALLKRLVQSDRDAVMKAAKKIAESSG